MEPGNRSFLYQNRLYLGVYLLLLALAAALQIVYSPTALLLWINRHWHPAADVFFRAVTFLGDGLFCVGVALLLCLYSLRQAFLVVVGYVVSGLLAQTGKRLLFPHAPRPARYFDDILSALHTVPGVELHQFGSFPSGHTATAFALFTVLAFETKHPLCKPLWLVPAVLVAYSRVYLLQHFVLDVTVGSLVGVLTVLLVYPYRNRFPDYRPMRWLPRQPQV